MAQASLPADLDFTVDKAASPERMNRAMTNLDRRIAALETYQPQFDALLAQLKQIGLSRLNDALLPIYNEIVGLADLGAIFQATSQSAVAIGTGPVTFVVDEGSRQAFAPAAWMAAMTADASAAMAGKVLSYDRTSGELVVQVTYVVGTGTASSWIVSPTAPPLLGAAEVDAGTITAPLTTVRLRRSDTAGEAPATLQEGELALNQADKLLFFPDSGNIVRAMPLTVAAILANAVLTGTVVAPTPLAGDASTKVATTAFVASALAGLVNSAPAALDTLKELADALGDDANFAATMATALGNRLRFDASQTLTGAQIATALANLGAGTFGSSFLASTSQSAAQSLLSVDPNASKAGQIGMFLMTSAPSGWLKANGANVSRSTYAALFAAIGTTYGSGDGSTTFTLPDARGEFFRGLDDGRGVDSGRTLAAWQSSQNLSHTHGVTDTGHAHSVYDPGHQHVVTGNYWNGFGSGSGAAGNSGNLGVGDQPTTTAATGIGIYANGTGVSIQSAGGSEARPRNLSALICVKY